MKNETEIEFQDLNIHKQIISLQAKVVSQL